MESAPPDPPSISLRGEKATVRGHHRDDAGAAFVLLHEKERILSWLTWDGPASALELEEYYAEWCFRTEDGDDYRLGIVDNASGALAGSISLRFVGHPGVGDVGYWVGAPFQGHGLATEALTLAAHWAFRYLDTQALFAWVFDGNRASMKVLERNGFVHVRSRSTEWKDGERRREHHMIVLAEDWNERFAGWLPGREDISPPR